MFHMVIMDYWQIWIIVVFSFQGSFRLVGFIGFLNLLPSSLTQKPHVEDDFLEISLILRIPP